MIVLFTDFGSQDPYVGQLHAVLAQQAPGVPVIDLFHNVPNQNVRAGAYLLPSYISLFPEDTVFMCVVDPGVGGKRRPLYLRVDDIWFVGPDNGLFRILLRRALRVECFTIDWRPRELSSSFHGRDLFAPVAAMLSKGEPPDAAPVTLDTGEDEQWPDDTAEVIYVDHYGNATTGYRAAVMPQDAKIRINGILLSRAKTYSDVATGEAFWYENANGLVEFAVNQGRADKQLAIRISTPFSIHS
ncbi:MAG: S-adenosyl-l-methionine hydroxide adenosyltransferase family protein [Acidiferrobacterales bacterium]